MSNNGYKAVDFYVGVNCFLKYLVTKSRSLVNLDRRELNPISSVTRELALCYVSAVK